MTVSVTHSTPADSSFSTTGATAWNADHTLTGVGTMAEQNANAVAVTGGTVNNTAIGGTTPAAGTFTTLIGGGGSANYEQITGGATGKAVQFQSLGSDAAVSLAIQSKGTGAIDLAAGSSGVNISNGDTVTAITITSGGSYSVVPTVTISAPTTAGGVQATGSVAMQLTSSSTVSAAGTGYAIGDTITLSGGTFTQVAVLTVATLSGSGVATFTVTTSGTYTALPSNPISTTSSGAGTGFRLTGVWTVKTAGIVGTAGSGYVEQPTITFSSGSAAAYASVGAEPTIRSLFGGVTTTGLAIATAGGNQVRFVDVGDGTRPIQLFGGSAGGAAIGGINQPVSSAVMSYSTNAAAHNFYTTGRGSGLQFQISTTASAVNYVQVTGATTASKVVAISAQGSDTDVTLSLSPKGAGTIRFGTHTGTILTPTGYITITDSGGTTRRLLVG